MQNYGRTPHTSSKMSSRIPGDLARMALLLSLLLAKIVKAREAGNWPSRPAGVKLKPGGRLQSSLLVNVSDAAHSQGDILLQ